MPSAYIDPSEYAAYGIPDASVGDVQSASNTIDAYLERPEGLVWMPDAAGLPCYMAGLSATFTFTLAAPIAAGSNVTVPCAAVAAGMADLIGEVFILDRSQPGKCEAVTVSAVDPQHGTVTFARVAHAHASGAVLEAGLVIVEDRQLAAKRSITRASRSPIVRLLSGLGRYSYGRRSDQISGLSNDINLLATVAQFGAPQWIPFDVTQAPISTATGEIWVPAGLMISYFSEVRLRYVAGFPAAHVPEGLKRATAKVVGYNASFGDIDQSFKTFTAGGTKVERFSDTALDADTKSRIEPYRAKLFF